MSTALDNEHKTAPGEMNYDACGRQRKTAPGEHGCGKVQNAVASDQIAADANQKGLEPPQSDREQRITPVRAIAARCR